VKFAYFERGFEHKTARFEQESEVFARCSAQAIRELRLLSRSANDDSRGESLLK
jgi:hypothetical protein